MDLDATIILAVVSTALIVLSLWNLRRKRAPGALPLVPWNGLLFVAVVALMAALAHLISLTTGADLTLRR